MSTLRGHGGLYSESEGKYSNLWAAGCQAQNSRGFSLFFTFFLVSRDYALESRRSERFEQGVGSLQKFLVRSKVN